MQNDAPRPPEPVRRERCRPYPHPRTPGPDSPSHQTYLTRVLRPAGTTPSMCRQTRIAQLVTDLDPKLAATALGMQDAGLVRYLAGNVDRDRLGRTAGIGQRTRAL